MAAPTGALLEQLDRPDSVAAADGLNHLGHLDQTMESAVRPLYPAFQRFGVM